MSGLSCGAFQLAQAFVTACGLETMFGMQQQFQASQQQQSLRSTMNKVPTASTTGGNSQQPGIFSRFFSWGGSSSAVSENSNAAIIQRAQRRLEMLQKEVAAISESIKFYSRVAADKNTGRKERIDALTKVKKLVSNQNTKKGKLENISHAVEALRERHDQNEDASLLEGLSVAMTQSASGAKAVSVEKMTEVGVQMQTLEAERMETDRIMSYPISASNENFADIYGDSMTDEDIGRELEELGIQVDVEPGAASASRDGMFTAVTLVPCSPPSDDDASFGSTRFRSALPVTQQHRS